jgi:transcriptional regulator with XRE-family HTH domain
MGRGKAKQKTAKGIGALLRRIRKSQGMSQIKLSEKIGVSYQQVQKYEYGISNPTISRLKQIADALCVPVSIFIEENGKITTENDDENRLLMLFRGLKDKKTKHMAIKILEVISETAKTD